MKVTFPGRAWLPLALTVLITTTFLVAYRLFVLCIPAFCSPDASLLSTLSSLIEISGAAQRAALPYRILWLTALSVAFLVPILCVGIAGTCLWHLDKKNRTLRVGVTAAIALVAAVLFGLAHSSSPQHQWRQFVHPGILTDFPAVLWILPWFDALSILTTITVACAVTGLIAEASDKDTKLSDVIRHRRWMNTILYVSATHLVVSLVRLRFFMDWSVGYVLPLSDSAPEHLKLAQASLDPIVTAITTAMAVMYTMLLLAISLPTALTIQAAGEARVTGAQPPTSEETEWAGMTTIGAKSPRLLAILAPFLSGLIAELVKAAQ